MSANTAGLLARGRVSYPDTAIPKALVVKVPRLRPAFHVRAEQRLPIGVMHEVVRAFIAVTAGPPRFDEPDEGVVPVHLLIAVTHGQIAFQQGPIAVHIIVAINQGLVVAIHLLLDEVDKFLRRATEPLECRPWVPGVTVSEFPMHTLPVHGADSVGHAVLDKAFQIMLRTGLPFDTTNAQRGNE